MLIAGSGERQLHGGNHMVGEGVRPAPVRFDQLRDLGVGLRPLWTHRLDTGSDLASAGRRLYHIRHCDVAALAAGLNDRHAGYPGVHDLVRVSRHDQIDGARLDGVGEPDHLAGTDQAAAASTCVSKQQGKVRPLGPHLGKHIMDRESAFAEAKARGQLLLSRWL